MDTPLIYVVDDEPGIAMLCDRLLSRAGYRVESETSPPRAIEFFRQKEIDLLLVDIRMPEVDGFELINHLRQIQPESAVLIMTGHGTVETAIRALRQGVDGLLLKPFDQGSDLIDAVKLAFQDNQQRRDAARTRALRPLFSVTESLLSETRRGPLLDLIVDAVCAHLKCQHAACFLRNPEHKIYELTCSRGAAFDDSQSWLDQVTACTAPALIQSAGAGKDSLNSLLEALTLESVILMPILRPEMQMVLVAARHQPNPAFGDSDLELLQILASQAMAALENSRLYEKQLEYVRRVEESQRALLQAEKMAAAGRLSASIAHEVGNPLQSVQNCLHLASREDLPEGKRAEYFDMAQKELDRLMGTVSRLLDFYRPGVVSLEKVDLEDMLQYVSNLMGKQLSEANIRVSIDLLGRIPSIAAVAGQIQQVFINLCLNAVDAMPGGGLLRITARPQEGGVEILFQDNGRGIPYDQQSNIFEPFFSTKEGGTGLGLTVSYNIITAHGGTLELLPNQARGACFRIFLPAGECQ